MIIFTDTKNNIDSVECSVILMGNTLLIGA